MQNLSHKTYWFEGFILDLERACLRREGQEIKLRPKSFESLKYLIENRGRLVTKDELMHAVWPDSFVTDDSLVQCVRDIRRSLGDNSQHFIKTVPRRGYIFEAEVIENGSTRGTIQTGLGGGSKLLAGENEPAVERTRTSPGLLALASQPWTQSLWRWTGAVVLIVIAASVGFYFWPKNAPPLWRPVPLTSYPDFELNPALSPDGNQVAFTWSGQTQDNYDIYIKLIGSSGQLRLTTNPVKDVSPAWSLDGRTIAFLRRWDEDRNELLLIPALGGLERKVAEIRIHTRTDHRLRSLAWSLDGDWLAVSHRESEDVAEALFLISARTGEKRRLTRPPPSYRGDFTPAFSPDGRTLAFSRLAGGSASDVYLLSLSEPIGEARRLTHHDLWAVNPVWTLDGRDIAEGGGATQITQSGGDAVMPLESPDGEALYYALDTRGEDNGVWRVPVQGGHAEQVTGPLSERVAFAITTDGLFYSARPDSRTQHLIRFLSFSTGQSRPVVMTDRPIGLGLSLSPDQRFLVFAQSDQTGSDLMLVENFIVR